MEFLTHDISVHVPHHVNSKIPWYNLRKAHASLQQNWGQVRSTATSNCTSAPWLSSSFLLLVSLCVRHCCFASARHKAGFACRLGYCHSGASSYLILMNSVR